MRNLHVSCSGGTRLEMIIPKLEGKALVAKID